MARIGIVSLGCPRNLIDSEVMLGSLKKARHEIYDELADGLDVFIINTCSFVESAREESVEAIMQAAQFKKEGRIKYIIVAGCLSQQYHDKLLKMLPEADALVGTSDFFKIADIVDSLLNRQAPPAVSRTLDYLYDEDSPRFLLTPPHYAYVKIAEGCDNLCSYCIISRLRGRFRSRTVESVVNEVKALSKSGALKEINLIAQDTTLFGKDIYGKSAFARLLKDIAALKNSVKWIRVLYTHPAHYTDELIDVVRDEPKICKYLDVPVQHINDGILKKMNRHTTKKDIISLLDRLRRGIPGVALRTSVIVGFPGEREEDFKELLEFLKEARFEKLGAFIYSKEEGSAAAGLDGQISDKVKAERFDAVMKLQQEISAGINKSFLGRTLDVLIDEPAEAGKFLGRTESDAPEVDGCVYVSGKNIKAGEFYKVRITDTLEYDLVGEIV